MWAVAKCGFSPFVILQREKQSKDDNENKELESFNRTDIFVCAYISL